jgi:hypothetical protein
LLNGRVPILMLANNKNLGNEEHSEKNDVAENADLQKC